MSDYVEEQIVRHEWTGNVDNISYGQIIVRCKDYKHWDKKSDSGYKDCMIHFSFSGGFATKGDFFCADGERAE